MIRLRTPFTTREPMECLFKVLDGTLVACGLGISKGPDVVFKVSFSTIIMSLVFFFKSLKLNNNVLTSLCTSSWSWTMYRLGMTRWLGRLGPSMISKLGLQWFEFILQSLNLNGMGLKHLPLVSIMLLLFNILTRIIHDGGNMNGRLRCLDFWLRGNKGCWKILSWQHELLPF
jgi:hypothetical protein